MFRIKQRSALVRSLATAAAAVAIAAVSAGPASAWPVDHPKIVGPNVDVGSNWNGAIAAPTAGGNLRWDTCLLYTSPSPRDRS